MSDISGINSANSLGNFTSFTNPQNQPAQSDAPITSSSGTAVEELVGNAKLATSGARGALALGGAGTPVSVLGAQLGDDATSLFGSLPSQNSGIMNQIIQTATQRFQDLQQQIQDSAASRNAVIEDQNNAWISVKADINNVNAAVSTGQDSIQQVANFLLSIRDSVALAGTQGEDAKLRAGQFDDTFNQIDNAADGAPASNLVGSINRVDFTPNQIEYRNSTGAGTTTLNGTYIATDYRIMASDGTVWVPDLGSDTITHYSELQGVEQTYTTAGISLPDSTSTRTGLKLVSYDSKTNAITMQVTINPEDPPRTVTGTLQRTGIGLMPSWFYDGLTTDAGRQRAYADINAAEVNLTSAGATLQVAAGQVATDSRRADNALDDLTKQTSQVQMDQLQQQQDLQQKSVQQLTALQNNLQGLQSTQQNYINMLAGAVDDPLGQSLIDMQI